MSYAGPVRPSSTTGRAHSGTGASGRPTPPRRPAPASSGREWGNLVIFGTGLALGIAVGAGVALLTAPQSGERTRRAIAKRTRSTTKMVGRRSRDAWDDLRGELRSAARALQRRKVRREARRDLELEMERAGEL